MTSENPNLPQMLPPTVATFLNCTPTICLTDSAIAPCVYAFRVSCVSICLRVAYAPILNSFSSSSIRSSPRQPAVGGAAGIGGVFRGQEGEGILGMLAGLPLVEQGLRLLLRGGPGSVGVGAVVVRLLGDDEDV